MFKYIIGIDPGLSGAVACLDVSTHDVTILDMPTYKGKTGKVVVNSMELLEILEPPSSEPGSVFAVLEQVWARPKEGVSSAFRFGRAYEACVTSLAAHKYDVRDVTPPVWKKYFGLKSDKGLSRGLAIQRFPRQAALFKRVKDDGRAEAALIALYGKEKLL